MSATVPLHHKSAVPRPTLEQLRCITAEYKLQLSDAELQEYREVITGMLGAYDALEEMPEPKLPVKYQRMPGYRPASSENPSRAWAWKSRVEGASGADLPLAGKTVVVKDNIALASVPMLNGCSLFSTLIPDEDATVVTRTLDAGAVILGKATCENLCLSGSSFTTTHGPVLNPHDPLRTAGGSSSGCGVLVANGEADLAIGGDQGGSIRIPAAWCGIVGLKPTHGLCPYTGILPIEPTIDYVGPMARTVGELATFLDVLAGSDALLDPRQREVGPHGSFHFAEHLHADLEAGVPGVRVGLLLEGFGVPDMDPAVAAAVRDAAQRLCAHLDRPLKEVSVPEHFPLAKQVWLGMFVEGAHEVMIRRNSSLTGQRGHFLSGAIDTFGSAKAVRAGELSVTTKLTVLMAEHLHRTTNGRFYARAQNQIRAIQAAYDRAFEHEVDVLIMPTIPYRATELPRARSGEDAAATASLASLVHTALGMVDNTAAFDGTGHPALSIPVPLSASCPGDPALAHLPIGMQLVARHNSERVLLAVAAACEQMLKAEAKLSL